MDLRTTARCLSGPYVSAVSRGPFCAPLEPPSTGSERAYFQRWELSLRSRALDNCIFVAGADIISTDPDLYCVGASLIVNPKGKVLARAEPGQEGIIDALLEERVLEAQRRRVPLFKDRRPGLYGRLVSG